MTKSSKNKLKEQEELDKFIKDFLGSLTDELVKKQVEAAANALGKSKAQIHAMKRQGSGSAVTFVKLLMHALELEKEDLEYFILNLDEIIAKKKGNYRLSQKLFKEVQRYTDENELVGWLRLLLAKVCLEADAGTRPLPDPSIKLFSNKLK